MSVSINSAMRATFDQFMEGYDPSLAPAFRSAGQTLLFGSVANRDIAARIAITLRLLDDGVDPSVLDADVNVLHVLFGPNKQHDAGLEAPMLRRLIECGADINQVSKRWGAPLIGLMENGPRPESAAVPFYDVIFDQPNLDLSVPYGQTTLREWILHGVYNLPILRERVLAYEESGHVY